MRVLNAKERINKFIKSHEPTEGSRYHPKDDKLTPDHWVQLERLQDCLTTFTAATTATEGADRFLYDYFTNLWFLDEIDA